MKYFPLKLLSFELAVSVITLDTAKELLNKLQILKTICAR